MADPAASGGGWWRERRLPGGPLHLDTAAVAAPSAIVALRDCTADDLDRLRQALLALD